MGVETSVFAAPESACGEMTEIVATGGGKLDWNEGEAENGPNGPNPAEDVWLRTVV